jgi:hypothetical protein
VIERRADGAWWCCFDPVKGVNAVSCYPCRTLIDAKRLADRHNREVAIYGVRGSISE